jgi:WhiB family redox-sensing transcriptional regulator
MTVRTLIPVEAVLANTDAAQHHTGSVGAFATDVRRPAVIPYRFDGLLPGEDDRWQDRALCSQTDPDAFFPEKGGSTREAKRVCQGCEVKNECLEYALAHDERFGVWGGLSERERRRLKRGIA